MGAATDCLGQGAQSHLAQDNAPCADEPAGFVHRDDEAFFAVARGQVEGQGGIVGRLGHRVIGHPAGQEIMHWFDIRGYSDGGAVTAYEDSVHAAPSVAWNGSVPAYSTLPSSTIVYILGARGYIW